MNGNIDLDTVKINLVSLTHSILEPNALFIKYNNKNIFHTGDWKCDLNPLIGDNINAIQITGVSGPSGNQGGSLTLKDAVSANQNDAIYVYQTRGLKDTSLLDFCGKIELKNGFQNLLNLNNF